MLDVRPLKILILKKMGRQIAMIKIIKMEESACLLFDRKSLWLQYGIVKVF